MLTFKKKQEIVAITTEKVKKALSMVVAEVSGLGVDAMNKLRKLSRARGVILKVIPKNLLRLAVKNTQYKCLIAHLSGPIIVAFSIDYPSTGARVLQRFQKENQNLKFKAACFEEKLILGDEIELLASFPTRKEAICNFILACKELAGGKLARILFIIQKNRNTIS